MARKDGLDIEVIGIDEIYQLAQRTRRLTDKILIYVLFLSCSRISEALKIRKKDIKYSAINGKGVVIFKNLIVLKRRGTVLRSPPVIINDDPIKAKMFTELKEYLDLIKDDNGLLFPKATRNAFNMRLKDAVQMHVRAYKANDNKEIEVIDDYKTNLYPHYLRHCGVTYLVNKYPNLDALRLTNFVGWCDPRQATHYFKSSWLSLFKAME